MDRNAVWQTIDAQRLGLAEILESLSDDEWAHPSLCDGWTVRDVVAHLTLQQLGWRDLAGLMGTMVKARGDLNAFIRDSARERAAALSTDRMIAEIRAMVGSQRHTLGVTYLETLSDILVHGQDITVPLGRSHPVPVEPAAVATNRLLSMRWPRPLPASRTVQGLRLVATDTAWSAGVGPEIRGPMGALLLLCAGRLVGLSQLSGEGMTELTARLAAPAR